MAKVKIDRGFGMIPNELLYNQEISLASKGLYGFIYAKPDDWDFSVERISAELKESVNTIRTYMKELEKFGWLTREKFKNEKGQWDVEYRLFSAPQKAKNRAENTEEKAKNHHQKTTDGELVTDESKNHKNHHQKTVDGKLANNKINNKKIYNYNPLNPLTGSIVEAQNTDKKSEKRVLFTKFFAKFPKKTHEMEAEIAFLNLTEDEIREISKIFPFWLEAWKNTSVDKLPNAYNWLYNKKWREPLPLKIPPVNPAELSQNPTEKPKPPRDFFPKIDKQKLREEAENRKKILEFFESLPDPKKQEITGRVTKKFEKYPAVKPGDILWQIEIARWVKPLVEAEKSKILAESF